MTKAAITTIGAALLAAAALALSGCSYPGDDEDRAAFHAEAQDPVPSAPATKPTEPETPAEEGGQGEKSGATADLGVEDGQVQHLRAIQNFSPALERWVLDEEAGEVTYGIVNCAGQTKSEGVATSRTKTEGGNFASMCAEAGETAADFVF